MIALAFYHVTRNEVQYVPLVVLDIYYGSNGMCAGNTPQEALIEGISEILERRSKKAFLSESFVAPDIPRAYLEKFPKICKMISDFEDSGSYKLWIKDCSLGFDYPT